MTSPPVRLHEPGTRSSPKRSPAAPTTGPGRQIHYVAEAPAGQPDWRQFSEQNAGLPLSDSEPGRPATITSVRNALEHGQNLAIRSGLGFASGPDGWWISYRDRNIPDQGPARCSQDLHRAIRTAVDPEAFSDFRDEHPFVELRDPETIVKPWRPGSEITVRQAASMAQIRAGLSRTLSAR
jgi:hypothetical protein